MSKTLETAKQFIEAFGTLDAEKFTRLKTPDCRQFFAPQSTNMPESKTNEEFEAHMLSLQKVLKGFPVYIKEIWDSDKQVVVWATSEAIFREEAMDDGVPREKWNFRGEYMFVLEMNESGDKITKVVEFLDSKATDEVRELMKRARKNLALQADIF